MAHNRRDMDTDEGVNEVRTLPKRTLSFALVTLFWVLFVLPPSYLQTTDLVLIPVADTYIQSDSNRINGYTTELEVRIVGLSQTFSIVLLKFDLGVIPKDAEVLRAQLTLRSAAVDFGGITVASYFSRNTVWEESSAVWSNSQFALNPDGPASSTVRVDQTALDYTFNILSDVKAGLNVSALTEVLKPANDRETGRATFYSKEWRDTSQIPRLYITYDRPRPISTITGQSITGTTIPPTIGIVAGFEPLLPFVAGAVGLTAILVLGLGLARRHRDVATEAHAEAPVQRPPPIISTKVSRISSGKRTLDLMLDNGLPERTSLAFVGASSQELDNFFLSFLQANCERNVWTLYCTTRELSSVAKMLDQHPKFAVMVCHSAADLMYRGKPRVFRAKLAPNDVSIARAEFEKLVGNDIGPKAALVETVSALMLSGDAKTVRLWLSDFLEKLKYKGFSIIAHVDPLLHSKDDVAIVETVFDGQLDVEEDKRTGDKHIRIRRLPGIDYGKGRIRID